MGTKIECKVFFITDFNQQAQYLTEMHRKGWRLTKIRWSFFYHFEKCELEDMSPTKLILKKVKTRIENPIYACTRTMVGNLSHHAKTSLFLGRQL